MSRLPFEHILSDNHPKKTFRPVRLVLLAGLWFAVVTAGPVPPLLGAPQATGQVRALKDAGTVPPLPGLEQADALRAALRDEGGPHGVGAQKRPRSGSGTPFGLDLLNLRDFLLMGLSALGTALLMAVAFILARGLSPVRKPPLAPLYEAGLPPHLALNTTSALFDVMQEGIWIVDPEFTILYVNRRLPEIFGVRTEDMIGKKTFDFFDEKNRERLQERMDARRRGVSEQYDYHHHRPDGTDVWVLLSGAPIQDRRGRFAGAISVFTDITDRKQAEEAVRENRDLLQLVIDAMPGVIVYADRENRYRLTNRAFGDWFAVDHRSVVGKTYNEVLSPEYRSHVEAAVARMLQGEKFTIERKHTYPDGRIRWIEASYVPHINTGGKVVGSIGMLIDNTESIRSREDLQTSEQRYRTLVEGSIQGIAIIQDFKLVFANSTLAHMYGYESAEDIIGGDTLELFIAPHERKRIMAMHQARLRGEMVPNHYTFEGRKKDGSPLHLESLATRLDWEGKPAALVTYMDVTERMRTEEELHTQRRLLQLVFDAIPHPIYLKDHERRYRMVNRVMADHHGVEPEAMIGRTIEELPHRREGEIREITDADLQVFNSGDRVDIPEIEVTLKDGSTQWQHHIKVPMLDAAGKVTGVIGLAEDITAYKQAEEELRASQRLMDAVFESVPVGVSVKDRQARYMRVNRAFRQMFSVEMENVLGRRFDELGQGSPEQIQRVTSEDLRVLTEGILLDIHQSEVRTPDGKRAWRQNIKMPLRNDAGEIEGLVAVIMDITHRVESENRLRESQQLLRTVFDALPLWVTLKDTESRLVMCNHRYAKDLGSTVEALEGTLPNTYWKEESPTRELVLDKEREVIATGIPVDFPPYETRLPNGTVITQRTSKVPIFGEGGEVTGLVTVSQDITEQIAQEERVKEAYLVRDRMQSQLVEVSRLAAMGELAGGIAHEINNPLAVIASSTELLEDALPEDIAGTGLDVETWRRHLRKINETVFRCKGVIQSLLQFARRESELMGTVDLVMLLRETIDQVGSSSQARYREFNLDIGTPEAWSEGQDHPGDQDQPLMQITASPYSLRTSAAQVQQVFINLLLNAVQATETQDRIDIFIHPSENGIVIRIRDSGEGIAPENLPRVFEPFFSTKPKGQGTGMGLSLSRQIVTSLGGKIEVESEFGHGSTFTVWLPRDRESLQTQLQGSS